MTPDRRRFMLGTAGASLAAASVAKAALAALPELASRDTPETAPPRAPSQGPHYNPVVTLNGWSLPWRMRQGVKEFHLVAEPVVREMAPGFRAHLWGYNGQSPGPTIEVVEGDRVRLFVTNRLPERTSIHWHGQRLPNGMDGVAGLTQPAIEPGKTYVYEFVARRPGTFMYHPHADEMLQMAMGMMGSWVTHPRHPGPLVAEVDRDYIFLMNAYDVAPGASVPKASTMTDFNLWSWNSRVFPGIAPFVARLGDRVRIRVGNLSMTNHPMHIHGHEMVVTGTDGGATPLAARWPEVSVDIAVGQMRQLEFVADAEGDWAFHCHKAHHTMNAMGHDVPNLLGVEQRDVLAKIRALVPGAMAMGDKGMSDMTDMEMPLPPNTLPMMGGEGPFGSLEMGGMFSVVKVRRDQKPGDYGDPGWYVHPAGTTAYEWTGELPPAPAAGTSGQQPAPRPEAGAASGARAGLEVRARKPGAHMEH
jgi:FtsP/CotA-like multicopper oxidase with cupredoxin domain